MREDPGTIPAGPIAGPLFPKRRRDFDRFRTAIYRREPDYVPLAEMFVEKEVKTGLLGQPVDGHGDEIRFWQWAGYDYYPVSWSIVDPGRAIGGTPADKHYSIYPQVYTERHWARMHKGVVSNREEFERYQWPSVDPDRSQALDEIAALLPEGMKIMVILGKLFTTNWLLQGMETFFVNTVQNLELVEMIYHKISSLQMQIFEQVIEHPAVGGVWHPDDMAGRKNTFLQPEHFRQYCFPTYKKMGEVCRQLGKPMIFHSDGNISSLLDDVVDARFDAIHPVEAKAMDIFQIERNYGDKLALIGNIDLDLLSRGTPAQVETEARRLIQGLAPGGGYLLAAGNSVPEYVPLENYKAMLLAAHKYGRYPIRL